MNRVLPVPEGLTDLHADVGLVKPLGLSCAKAGEILVQGGVAIGKAVLKESGALQSGEALEVTASIHPKVHASEVIPVPGLKLLYEDVDLVVVDRPAGAAAHTGLSWDRPTVVGALRVAGVRIFTSGPVEREGIMHRPNAGTSGAMVAAKSELAHGELKNAFRYHRVEKIYLAVARGILKPSLGTIDTPIGRTPGREFKITVVVGGKPVMTHYDTMESLPGATLARVQLEMGHTYQTRVHFTVIGHPLLGDTECGADARQAVRLGLERQWLHTSRLVLKHPCIGTEIAMGSPLPSDL